MTPLGRRLVLLVADALCLNAAAVLAYLIRFEGNPPGQYLNQYEFVALPFTLLSLGAFHLSGLYTRLWRYASVDEVFTVLKGTTASAVLLAALAHALPALGPVLGWSALAATRGFPRSIVLLTWLLATVLVGGLRFSIRLSRRAAHSWRRALLSFNGNGRPGDARGVGTGQPTGAVPRRVLIVGAGEAGSLVARELSKHPELGCEPVGFLDDDLRKQGLRVHGLPVLGTRGDLGEVVARLGVQEVLIAMPSAPGRVLSEIVEACRDLPVRVKTLPGMYELVDGKVTVNQIRDVQIEDLLGREPVEINLDEVAGYLRGRRVLVTGAGGSIGSELCRQVARFQPAELLLLDHSENGLFEVSLELEHRFPELRQRLLVADIRDREKMERLFGEHRPEVVFHAAAHKHVPLMEAQPDEAVKTNIFGTKNVAEAALRHGARRFVLISTDKAVNPTSVMGATKRVAEMLVQALDAERRERNPDGTRFVAVRFGNVLGSRGSVVPVFKEQIARGGPVTVTHPEMRRYFMTIPEAVQLVIQAGAMGEGGEIFTLDMGEPVRILDLAENLIRLSGFEPGVDIPIVITGPRPGEKLFEELLTAEEGTAGTRHKRIYVGRIPSVDPTRLGRRLAALAELVHKVDGAGALVAALGEMVPNFRPAWWADTAAALDRNSVALFGVGDEM